MSVRKKFTELLYKEMAIDQRIILVVGDALYTDIGEENVNAYA